MGVVVFLREEEYMIGVFVGTLVRWVLFPNQCNISLIFCSTVLSNIWLKEDFTIFSSLLRLIRHLL